MQKTYDREKLEKDLALVMADFLIYYQTKRNLEAAEKNLVADAESTKILRDNLLFVLEGQYAAYRRRREKAEEAYGYSLVDSVIEGSFNDWLEAERKISGQKFIEDYVAQQFNCLECKHVRFSGNFCNAFQELPIVLFAQCPVFKKTVEK